MPSDRLFKFSSCGIMFLGALLFFFLLFGGKLDVKGYNDFTLTEGFNIFLSLFFGTPVIGIIISTITVKFFYLRWGYRYYCYVPTDRVVIDGVIERYEELSDLQKNSDDWSRSQVARFYPFYQVELRKIVKDDLLKFLDRRWSAAGTQLSNVAAIIYAFFVMFFLQGPSIQICEGYQIVVLIFLVLYVLFAVLNIVQSRDEAASVEHISLANYYREQRGKLNPAADSKESKTGILQEILRWIFNRR